MEILLGLLATKLVAGIIGVAALLGGKSPDVVFSKPEVKVVSDSMYISTTLKNSFPDELEKIVLSGTPITIRLKVSLSTRDTTLTQEAVHQIEYELTTKTFLFRKGGSFVQVSQVKPAPTGARPLQRLKDIDEVKELMNGFNIGINFEPPQGEKCVVILRATIDPIKIEAMGGKEFELMCFWDYHTPTLKAVISAK